MSTYQTASPQYFGGADLGQSRDPTALAIVQRTEQPDPAKPSRMLGHYHCGYLQRFPLGTPYPQVVDILKGIYKEPPLKGTNLAIDYTGVGRPVYDSLLEERITATLRPVVLTGGLTVSCAETGEWHVPKRSLCGVLQLLLQSRRLVIASDLPEAAQLIKELQTFSVKITTSLNETYEAWRDGDHDDLVLALAFACWAGELFRPWEAASSIPNPPRPLLDKARFSYKQPAGRQHSRRLYGRDRRGTGY